MNFAAMEGGELVDTNSWDYDWSSLAIIDPARYTQESPWP